MKRNAPIRISEWATVNVSKLLSGQQREELTEASKVWQEANAANTAPLSFSGPRGEMLCARQFVGVVEVGDVTIEVYPKLDRKLISQELISSNQLASSVMQDLLWMLEVSGYMDISETDTAHLYEQRITFYDVFAYLMAKNLLVELQSGVIHSYVSIQDAIPAVRGRINIVEQVTTHWNRLDRVSCVWDEFTPDNPINRLFKCVCQVLNDRVTNSSVSRVLVDCLIHLDSVQDVSPRMALKGIEGFRWDRSNERLKMCFDMAIRLLVGAGYRMTHGSADTFVFMVDMNKIFESFAENVLAARFEVGIQTQKSIGTLFSEPRKSHQLPDYQWTVNNKKWIGDAKYKHLASEGEDALSFINDVADDGLEGEAGKAACRLNTSDVRQLIVYAELFRQRNALTVTPDVAVLYPFVGDGKFEASRATAFNNSKFWVMPVKVKRVDHPSKAIPANL